MLKLTREEKSLSYTTSGADQPPYDRLYKVIRADCLEYVLMGGKFHESKGSTSEHWRVASGNALEWSDSARRDGCRIAGCKLANSSRRHWHISPESVVTREFGARMPIACSCGDWTYRGVQGADVAKKGCKHMFAVRRYLGLFMTQP
jgi:hypothetical protein